MSTYSWRSRHLTCARTDALPWGRDSLLQQSVWANCLQRHCTRGHFGAPMAPGNPQASCMGLSCCMQLCLHLAIDVLRRFERITGQRPYRCPYSADVCGGAHTECQAPLRPQSLLQEPE